MVLGEIWGSEEQNEKEGKGKEKEEKEKGSDFLLIFYISMTFHDPFRRKMAALEKIETEDLGKKIRRGKTIFSFFHFSQILIFFSSSPLPASP